MQRIMDIRNRHTPVYTRLMDSLVMFFTTNTQIATGGMAEPIHTGFWTDETAFTPNGRLKPRNNNADHQQAMGSPPK